MSITAHVRTGAVAVLVALAGLVSTPAAAGVLYVRADLASGANNGGSWADAFRGRLGLQSALAIAQAGDQVWVAQGTYAPAGAGGSRMTAIMLRNGVEILGGFSGVETQAGQRNPAAHPTVLTGDLNGDDNGSGHECDNAAHVVGSTGNDATASIDGFIITGGYAVDCGQLNLVDRRDGAGMLIVGGSPTVRSCTFRMNICNGAGAGLCVDGAGPGILACTFDQNTSYDYGAGAASIHGSTASFEGCTFTKNEGGQGSGIYHGARFGDPADTGVLTVRGCLFVSNDGDIGATSGGGVMGRQSTVEIEGSTFDRNTANGGGGVFFEDAVASIRGCLFTGNIANGDLGDAITQREGSAEIVNCAVVGHLRRGTAFSDASPILVLGLMKVDHCTLANNGGTDTNQNFGSGLFVVQTGGDLRVSNSIAWGNRSFGGTGQEAVLGLFGGSARFDSCCIQGWNGTLTGVGSFNADPKLTDPNGADNILGTADDNVRLLAGSPCIDRGSNALALEVEILDLDGQDRFVNDGAASDLGVPGGAGGCAIADLGAYERVPAGYCPADVDCSGFVDTEDYDAFVVTFEAGDASADFDLSGFADTEDFDAFVEAFEAGC